MTLKVLTVLAFAGLVLAACASREEIAAKKAAADQAAQASREARCTSFGYKAGTPDYSKCLESMYLQDQQIAVAAEENRRARLQAAGQALQQSAAAMQSINPPPVVHCNTVPTVLGGTSTTCQ